MSSWYCSLPVWQRDSFKAFRLTSRQAIVLPLSGISEVLRVLCTRTSVAQRTTQRETQARTYYTSVYGVTVT